jgi:hypothetical protein
MGFFGDVSFFGTRNIGHIDFFKPFIINCLKKNMSYVPMCSKKCVTKKIPLNPNSKILDKYSELVDTLVACR